jgi:hypothetical protein
MSVELERERTARGMNLRSADGRSVGELFRDLRDEMTRLLRQELQLAKAESSEKAKVFGRSGIMAGAGAAIGLAGLLVALLGIGFLVSALLVMAGLRDLHARWIGPLGVGVIVGIVGYILVRKAMNNFKKESLVPERTIESLQENQEWAKHKLS